MSVESVQSERVERVENRRPSQVFLALWRDRAIGAGISVDEFGALADVWQQIRELEAIATRERQRASVAELADMWFPHRADNIRPYIGEAKPAETIPDRVQDEAAGSGDPALRGETEGNGGPSGTPVPTVAGDVRGVSVSDTLTDELAPIQVDLDSAPESKRYTGYLSSVKNQVRGRMLAMRSAGLTTGKLMSAANGRISYGDLMNILEANPVRFDVYETLGKILDEIEAETEKEP